MMQRLPTDRAGIARAAKWLRAGRLVAFPTETVYGLGADACNPAAVRHIFAVKGRPADHPVIVHLPVAAAMSEWAATVPAVAQRLAQAFWPGPLTLVLPRRADVDSVVTGGQDTIGLRVPEHPVAQALLQAFGGGLAAPSANRFGHVSPTTAEHVLSEFADSDVAAVLDGGACKVGLESTIVDVSSDCPRLLRPGMIAHEQLQWVLGAPLAIAADDEGPRASGRLISHYAPTAAVALVESAQLAASVAAALSTGKRLRVLGYSTRPEAQTRFGWIDMPTAATDYAKRLYAELRRADSSNPDLIIIERPPDNSGWCAINDRLQRAAAA